VFSNSEKKTIENKKTGRGLQGKSNSSLFLAKRTASPHRERKRGRKVTTKVAEEGKLTRVKEGSRRHIMGKEELPEGSASHCSSRTNAPPVERRKGLKKCEEKKQATHRLKKKKVVLRS